MLILYMGLLVEISLLLSVIANNADKIDNIVLINDTMVMGYILKVSRVKNGYFV